MRYTRRINYYETDRMDFVHHSNYIRYFEEARVWLMDSFGLRYADIENMGMIIPVLGFEVKYLKHLTFGDEIEIETRITKFTGVKMTVSYEVYNKADGTLTTTGESSHCFLDAASFKPVNLKISYPDIYEGFLKIADSYDK